MDYLIVYEDGYTVVKNVEQIENGEDELIFYNAVGDIVAIVNKDKYEVIKES